MKTVKNKFIPFGKFKAIMLFGVVFYKGSKLTQTQYNHEFYHMMQWRDVTTIVAVPLVFISAMFGWFWLLAIPLIYYVIYILEWLIRLVIVKDAIEAYKSISFERDAREYEHIIFGDCTAEKSWYSFGWLKQLFKK
jgi:hypothetical protein